MQSRARKNVTKYFYLKISLACQRASLMFLRENNIRCVWVIIDILTTAMIPSLHTTALHSNTHIYLCMSYWLVIKIMETKDFHMEIPSSFIFKEIMT